MKKFAFALSIGVVGLLLKTTAVFAQGTVPDHLLCYTVKDPLKLPTGNSLDMLADPQGEFTQKGCTLVKPVEFCVPAIKTNVTGVTTTNVNGQPLQNDFVCYTMKCPDAVRPTSKQITDQFGQRLDLMVKPVRICVPAFKEPLGCPVGSTNAAGCGGPCPDPKQVCHFGPATKGAKPTCECVTPTNGCAGKPDKFGNCGGDCSAKPGTVCQPSIILTTGTHTCDCLPPPPPGCSIDPATGICGGTCPTDPTATCGMDSASKCTCIHSTPCQGPAGPNGCGGQCTNGQVCHPDATTGICSCGCSQNPLTGTCGGDCPAGSGETCQLTSTGCNCVPTTNRPCSVDAQGTCGGICPPGSPPGATCGLDASGACNCGSGVPGCGPVAGTTNACNNGFCPAPETCQLITAGAAPFCGCK